MPVHDWTRVSDGEFHDFHQDFIAALRRRLNGGLLPANLYAAIDRNLRTRGDRDPLRAAPDILAITEPGGGGQLAGGLSVTAAPPVLPLLDVAAGDDYTRVANRVAVRTTEGDELVAAFELVSPGNKSSAARLDRFTRKCGRLIRRGVHVTLADLHPPTRRDPDGLHPVVWDRIALRPYLPPVGKPFTVAAYAAGETPRAYVQRLAIGDPLPDAPLFIASDRYIPLPLEAVYTDCWANYPPRLRRRVEPPADA